MKLNENLTLYIDAPFLPVDEYARRTGQTVTAVRKQCQSAKLPIMPRENHKSPFMINMVLLFKKANEREY